MKESSPKKIWLITELFYPEEDATAYIFTKIANCLTTEFKVNVICGPSSYDGNKKKITNEASLNKDIIIYRSNTLKLNKNNLLQRTFRFLILSFQLSNTLRKKVSKGDIVFLATNPAPLLILVGFLKYFKAFQLHILVHDVFPENTIAAGIFNKKSNVVYKLLKTIFDYGYSQADHIIVLGKDMKELIQNKSKSKKNISIITNWADIENIVPIKRSDSLIRKWGLEEKIVLQYAGNIGRVQGLKEVLEAFYLSNNRNIHLAIFGSGAYASTIRQFVKEKNIQNISFHGNFSRQEQQKILNACDIGIVSLSKGMYGLGVPSKTYNILAAGKPVLFIGELGSEISSLVLKEEIGWAIDISLKDDLTSFFSNLSFNTMDELISKGIKARTVAENNYSESKILIDLLKSIKNIPQ